MFQTIFQKKKHLDCSKPIQGRYKCSEFRSEPFAEEKNMHSDFNVNPEAKEKSFVNMFHNNQGQRKTLMTFKTHFFTEIRSVLNLGFGYSETHGIP
jgi:hypothetical protein